MKLNTCVPFSGHALHICNHSTCTCYFYGEREHALAWSVGVLGGPALDLRSCSRSIKGSKNNFISLSGTLWFQLRIFFSSAYLIIFISLLTKCLPK
jgi:hypothetical protein